MDPIPLYKELVENIRKAFNQAKRETEERYSAQASEHQEADFKLMRNVEQTVSAMERYLEAKNPIRLHREITLFYQMVSEMVKMPAVQQESIFVAQLIPAVMSFLSHETIAELKKRL